MRAFEDSRNRDGLGFEVPLTPEAWNPASACVGGTMGCPEQGRTSPPRGSWPVSAWHSHDSNRNSVTIWDREAVYS